MGRNAVGVESLNKPRGTLGQAAKPLRKAEVDLIANRLLGTETQKASVLPLLLDGEKTASLPPLLHGRVYADFRDELAYFTTAFDLILSLYQLPPNHPAVADLRVATRAGDEVGQRCVGDRSGCWTRNTARCTIVVVAASRLKKDNTMQTLCVSEKTGSDGILHLRIPVGQPEAEYDAVVVLQPRAADYASGMPESLGWPSGYFERTFGSITDQTFLRPPQGELPEAVELE